MGSGFVLALDRRRPVLDAGKDGAAADRIFVRRILCLRSGRSLLGRLLLRRLHFDRESRHGRKPCLHSAGQNAGGTLGKMERYGMDDRTGRAADDPLYGRSQGVRGRRTFDRRARRHGLFLLFVEQRERRDDPCGYGQCERSALAGPPHFPRHGYGQAEHFGCRPQRRQVPGGY